MKFQVKIDFMSTLFKKYVEHIVDYMIKNCKFTVPISYFSMTTVLCKMMWSQILSGLDKLK